MFSWEVNDFDPDKNDNENVRFAQMACQSMNLETMADKDFVYKNVSVQTQLFPEFGGYRDVAFMWKYMLRGPPSIPAHCGLGQRHDVRDILRTIEGVMPATGLAFPSLTRPSSYTGKSEVFSENDVLHLHTLPDFDGTLGQRDSELFLSYLTVPYLRIPLLLDFFSSDYRMYALKNETLRNCLECCLSECGRFLPSAIWSDPQRCLPKEVPSEEDALIATSHGLLLNELQHSPKGVLDPVQRLVEWAACAASSVHDDSFQIILYVCRLSARVSSFSKHLLQCWRGEVPGFEVWKDALKGTQPNIKELGDLSHRLQSSLTDMSLLESEFVRENADGCDSTTKLAPKTLSGQLIARLHEIEAKSKLFLAGGPPADTEFSTGSGKVDDTDLVKYVRTAADIHAHLTLLYQANSKFNVDSCLSALSSIFFLSVRHNWNGNNLESKVSDAELTAALDDVRCKAFHFMEHLTEDDDGKDDFVKICQGVYQAVMSSENVNQNWCRVQGKRGVYVVSFDPLANPRISALESEGANLNPYMRTVVFDRKSTLLSNDYCPIGQKGYYEIEILLPDASAPQYGFASLPFRAHATEGCDGVGDNQQSWAVDGVSKKRLHKSEGGNEDCVGDCLYDCSWKKGDIIGLACDLKNNQVHVSVNGSFDEPNGLIFELSSDDVQVGLFAAFTGVSGKLCYNLGQTTFKHAPPSSEFKAFVLFDTESYQGTTQNDCRVPVVANTGQYAVEVCTCMCVY